MLRRWAKSDVFERLTECGERAIGLTAFGVFDALEAPLHREDNWGSYGSWSVWPLRRPSPPDAARVKAWRKHAAAGTLPPIVLWSVSGLQTHLILDGHDRLRAARAEGVTPQVMVLWAVEEFGPAPSEMQRAVSAYRAHFEKAYVGEVGRGALSRSLHRAFSPVYAHGGTTARGRHDLDEEWDQEVRALLGGEAEGLCQVNY